MTLVVARTNFPHGPRLVSDLHVTDPDGGRTGYLEGVLKVVMVQPLLCIAFAGNLDEGLRALRDLGSEREEVVDSLLDSARRAREYVEFLVAGRAPTGLLTIKDHDSGVIPLDTSAEAGGFAYTVLTPVEPGVGAVGIYFTTGRLGVLYAPLLARAAFCCPNVSARAFVSVVQTDHRFALQGLFPAEGTD
jgi:hypothetical protein